MSRLSRLKLVKSSIVVVLFALVGFSFNGSQGIAGDWPQFLGVHRNGISDETGLLDRWPEDGPPEVFRVPGGVGMSGLSIVGDSLVTLVQRDGKQLAVCYHALEGHQRWLTVLSDEYTNSMGNGPRAAPTISGDAVYVFSGEGILTSLSLAGGTVNWKHDVVSELEGNPADYGMACSPLVVDGEVIVTAGCPNATVAAYDAKSGELRWTSGTDRAGYSSPALLELAGQPQIVVFSGSAVMGIKPKSGDLLWSYPYETDYDCNIVTPIKVGEYLFVSSGENHGSVMLSVEATDDGFKIGEIWESQGRDSVLRNEWQTAILAGGNLYGFDNQGSAGPITHLTCVSAKTGERLWQEQRFGKGNMILADGKLLMTTMEGEFVMAKASPAGYEELGRMTLLGMTRQAPALANGRVYLRDDQDIVCLDLRKSP